MKRDLSEIRAELPAIERLTYLNTSTAGPLPRTAIEAMHASLEEDLVLGRVSGRRTARVEREADDLRAQLGVMMNAEADRVALTSSTTHGIDIAVSALDLKRGSVLATTREHPAALLPFEQNEADGGARLMLADIDAQMSDGEIVEAITDSFAPDTRVVMFPHVLFGTGRILPVTQLVARAHECRIPVIIDGAQAAGVLPVSFDRLGAEFYAFSLKKWLNGPDGVGALLVSESARNAAHRIRGLGSSVEGSPLGARSGLRRRAGARALESVIPDKSVVRGALAALEWRSESATEEMIRLAVAERTCTLRTALDENPRVEVVPGGAGIVAFRHRDLSAATVEAALGAARVATRRIPGEEVVRVSAHFYTSGDDVSRLAEAVAALDSSVPDVELACPLQTQGGRP